MSNKPNPAALLAAMLEERRWNNAAIEHRLPLGPLDGGHASASLASDLCRLAPAIEHQGVAECNGEWVNESRANMYRIKDPAHQREALATLDKSISDKRAQLERRLSKLNTLLAPFSLIASGYAGGGLYLGISSTDASRPLDMIVGA